VLDENEVSRERLGVRYLAFPDGAKACATADSSSFNARSPLSCVRLGLGRSPVCQCLEERLLRFLQHLLEHAGSFHDGLPLIVNGPSLGKVRFLLLDPRSLSPLFQVNDASRPVRCSVTGTLVLDRVGLQPRLDLCLLAEVFLACSAS
jgi:hypothetical protein